MTMPAASKPAAELMISSRVEAPVPLEPLRLGPRVREIRQDRRWTLEEVSRRTGLGRSTLSKIENEQMSPTFEVMRKLAAGLGIEVPQLFAPAAERRSSGRRTLTRKGNGRPHPTATYEHELLCTELSQRRMVPFKSRIRARSFDEFPEWVRHEGEELVHVLHGAVELYTEFYEPVVMEEGDSAYFDSGMGHALVSVSEEAALVLWVCAP